MRVKIPTGVVSFEGGHCNVPTHECNARCLPGSAGECACTTHMHALLWWLTRQWYGLLPNYLSSLPVVSYERLWIYIIAVGWGVVNNDSWRTCWDRYTARVGVWQERSRGKVSLLHTLPSCIFTCYLLSKFPWTAFTDYHLDRFCELLIF